MFGDNSKIHGDAIVIGNENKYKELPEKLSEIEGQLPYVRDSDVITVINNYIYNGYKSGRILFATNNTNLPSIFNGSAFVEFYAYDGSGNVYLKAYNFSTTAMRAYLGRIYGTNIVWRYVELKE